LNDDSQTPRKLHESGSANESAAHNTSATLYASLKALGLSNRAAAEQLLDGNATLGDRPVASYIASKPQLSRRIVHAEPSSLPASCFKDFRETVPALAIQLLERYAVRNHKGKLLPAATAMVEHELVAAHEEMALALQACGADDAVYREALARIDRLNLTDAEALVTLHLMAFIVAGCTGDAHAALAQVVSYAVDVLGLESDTAETNVTEPSDQTDSASSPTYSIVRVENGRIKAGATLHAIGPDGLVIGLQPGSEPAATDVGADASLRHARVWQEGDALFVIDLNSTNGTTVTSGTTGEETIVAPPRSTRQEPYASQAFQLHYSDTIHLGKTTSYIVLPDIEASGTTR